MTTLPFPYPLDKWCEDTLTPEEGAWRAIAGFVELTNERFVVGQKCVKCYSPGYNYYIGVLFELVSPLSFLIYQNGTFHFKVNGTTNMSGTGYLTLFDTNGNSAQRLFSYSPYSWSQQDHKWSDFSVSPNFDWGNVKDIRIDFDMNSGSSNYAGYIDELYITFDVPDSILTIQSQPTGKSGKISTSYRPELFQPQQFVTPAQPNFLQSSNGIPQGLPILIEMDATTFDHWLDEPNNTNPSRTLTMPTTSLTLTAVYTVSPNPLLVIDSFDQNMENVSAPSAVRITYGGTPQVVNVPFGSRVPNKGTYTFTAISTANRVFKNWVKPDGTNDTNATITWNVQSDTRLEVHWEVTGTDGETNWLLIIGGVVAGIVVVALIATKK